MSLRAEVLRLRVVLKVTLADCDCAIKRAPTRYTVTPLTAYLGGPCLEFPIGQHCPAVAMREASLEIPPNTGTWFTRHGIALPCHLPLGVILDLLRLSDPIVSLTVHLRHFPVDKLLSGPRERLWCHALKQALFICYSSCGTFSAMSTSEQQQLWVAINSDSSGITPLFDRLFVPSLPLRGVPVRVLSADPDGVGWHRAVQPVVAPASTLIQVMASVCAGQGSSSVLVQSLKIDLLAAGGLGDLSMIELWRELRCLDGFLYIVIDS